MPIDRPAALRNAERFLRLGRLEEAIAEYRSVLDDQPLDWNTANALGDLYVRAGQLDQAVAHFVWTADTLAREGFVVRASALYKKILKFRPDHEYSLLRAAEIATDQGLMADARACLSSIVERRRARGDHAGVAEMTIQLASLDPADYQARAAGARARVYLGDVGGALKDLLQLAANAVSRGNPSDAIVVLREATDLEPGNLDVRARVADAYLAAGGVAQARRLAEATRAPHRRVGAASLARRIVRDRGQQVEAVEWFERAAQAPAATREEGHALLLDLADALESIGEVARALAVCLELRADAGDSREITARVRRLPKRQARE